MRNVKYRPLAAIALLAFSVAGHAETQIQPPPVATVGDFAHVQADRLMYIGKAAMLDAEQNYLSKLPASQAAIGEQSVSVPTLTNLIGANGIVFGHFQYADGTAVDRAVGEKIPGDFTIVHLWPEKVSGELRDRHGKIIVVGSSQTGSAVPSPAPTANALGGQAGSFVPSINGAQR